MSRNYDQEPVPPEQAVKMADEARAKGYAEGIARAADLVRDDAGIHSSPWLEDHIIALGEPSPGTRAAGESRTLLIAEDGFGVRPATPTEPGASPPDDVRGAIALATGYMSLATGEEVLAAQRILVRYLRELAARSPAPAGDGETGVT
jgi:hypothetical protein